MCLGACAVGRPPQGLGALRTRGLYLHYPPAGALRCDGRTDCGSPQPSSPRSRVAVPCRRAPEPPPRCCPLQPPPSPPPAPAPGWPPLSSASRPPSVSPRRVISLTLLSLACLALFSGSCCDRGERVTLVLRGHTGATSRHSPGQSWEREEEPRPPAVPRVSLATRTTPGRLLGYFHGCFPPLLPRGSVRDLRHPLRGGTNRTGPGLAVHLLHLR